MKNESNSTYLRQIKTFLFIALVFLFLFVLRATPKVTLPVAFALFIFAFTNPVMDRLTKLRIPSGISILIILVGVIAIFIVLAYFMFLMVNTLISKLPFYAERVRFIDQMLSEYAIEYFDDLPKDFSVLASLNVDWYSFLMTWLTSISSKALSILSNVMIILITLFFLLLERSSFMPKMSFALSKDKDVKISTLLNKINKQISKYLFFKSMISLATGICFYFTALVTGLDFALLWGFLAFILNFIPTIGSILVTVATILMAIIQFTPNWVLIVYVAVLTISIEMVIGNIIDPRLQGIQLNMSPLVILISLSVWSYIWGIAGMFLAVPIMSIIQITCAMIPSLKPIAILLSSGKSYAREVKEKEALKKNLTRKRRLREESLESSNTFYDVILPVGKNQVVEDENREE